MTGMEATRKTCQNEDMEDYLPTLDGKKRKDAEPGGSGVTAAAGGDQGGVTPNPYAVNYQTLVSYTAGLEDVILDRLFERKPELVTEFNRMIRDGKERLLIFKTLIKEL